MTTIAQKLQLINRAELKAKLDSKEKFHLWNVHRPKSNIIRSQGIALDAITAKFARKQIASKSETIVVYSGDNDSQSSKQAAEKLQSLGYTNVFVYEGGLKDWAESGLPLTKL